MNEPNTPDDTERTPYRQAMEAYNDPHFAAWFELAYPFGCSDIKLAHAQWTAESWGR